MRTRSRIALVAATATAALAVGTAVANACINVHIAPLVESAAPGETVAFSLVGLVEGAQYTVSVGGHEVASGASTGETVSGSFPMPDLGTKSLTTLLVAQVVHEDLEQSPWSTTSELTYRAPAPPPAQESAPAAKSKPAVATPAVSKARPRTARPAAPRPVVRAVQTPAPAAVRTVHAPAPAAVRTAHAPARAAARTRHAPAPAPAVAEPKPQRATTPRAVVVRTHVLPHEAREPRRADARPPRNAPRELARPASVPRVVVVNARAPRHTPWPLAALLLLLAAVPPAAAYVVRRRRPRPEPPDEVEVELQEMIAEERARRIQRV